MKAMNRLPLILLYLGFVSLALASLGLALQNPYYIPSYNFQTQFQTQSGTIQVLQEFDKLSEHLQFLRDFRIVRYLTRPGTVVLPHHSDAEFLVIVTRGRAIVKIFTEAEDKHAPLVLKQFDVLRVPAGAITYTINTSGEDDLEFIKLALPVNNPGQFQNLYPAGNQIPSSYYQVFNKKSLTAAFNAPYDEIKNALWGPDQWKNEVIVKLSEEKLRSLTEGAQEGVPSTKLGPVSLRDIKPKYSNDYGSFHEASPGNQFPPLQDLGIGASFLSLNKGSMFLPHFNRKAIILAYVAEGDGYNEIGSPYPINRQQEEKEEGYIERLAANIGGGDLYIIPAGYPVGVSASKDSKLKVVEFILNASDNSRMFLTGDGDNVVKHIDPTVVSNSPEDLEKLFKRQNLSFFVKREGNRVAWASS